MKNFVLSELNSKTLSKISIMQMDVRIFVGRIFSEIQIKKSLYGKLICYNVNILTVLRIPPTLCEVINFTYPG
jgi:hypothetical protein